MPEQQEIDHQQRYMHLLASSSLKLAEKERELKQIVTGVVIGATVLLFLWLNHEEAWQRKLDNALSYCLTPMSDGSCSTRDPSAYR